MIPISNGSLLLVVLWKHINIAVDAPGLSIDFIITDGEVHDCKISPEFLAQLPAVDYTIADKDYNKEELHEIIKQKS